MDEVNNIFYSQGLDFYFYGPFMDLYISDSYTVPTFPLFPAKWLWPNDFRGQNVYVSPCYIGFLSVLHFASTIKLNSIEWYIQLRNC